MSWTGWRLQHKRFACSTAALMGHVSSGKAHKRSRPRGSFMTRVRAGGTGVPMLSTHGDVLPLRELAGEMPNLLQRRHASGSIGFKRALRARGRAKVTARPSPCVGEVLLCPPPVLVSVQVSPVFFRFLHVASVFAAHRIQHTFMLSCSLCLENIVSSFFTIRCHFQHNCECQDSSPEDQLSS